jgi:hypothetical protein
METGMCNYIIHLMKYFTADNAKMYTTEEMWIISCSLILIIYKTALIGRHFRFYLNDSSSLQYVYQRRYRWTDQLPSHFT